MSNKKIERRDFLKSALFTTSLVGMSPVEMLFSSMIEGIVSEANAAAANASVLNNYMHISLSGGPPRWMFDLPLMPNGTKDNIGTNKMLITKINDFNSMNGEYALFKHGDYYYPHLWGSSVLDADGKRIALTELLQHSVMFRGVNLGADGHDLNRLKQNLPAPGGYSMDGLVASTSSKPIPAIYYVRNLGFRAPNGVGIINTSTSNPVSTLVSPFKFSNARSFGSGNEKESIIARAVSSLKERGQFADPKVKSLFNDTANAKSLFEKEFGNLSEVYNELLNKYKKIIMTNLYDNSIEGIDSRAFISDGSSRFKINSLTVPEGIDLRDMIISNGVTQGSANLTLHSSRNTSISRLAESMAITEYAITNNLSTTVMSSAGSMINVQFPRGGTSYTNGTLNSDVHEVASHPTMFLFTKYYRAFAGCLLELQKQLKAKGMYDNSVIHVSGDFNRSARVNGSGSDHGWKGSNASVFSGKVAGAEVLGNIKGENPSGSRGGGWGVAAGMKELGGRDMIIGNVASSITTMLGVPSPTPNDMSLLGLNAQGKVVNYAKKPENV